MAGIYSQGGSAGHRYAGWLSEVEAKNFQFGGKVFNGSPSAIYVGSNLVWKNWLLPKTKQDIMDAFGLRDGWAVIRATNAYLNQLAASDRDKAQQIADLMNSSDVYACGFGELFWKYTPCEYIQGSGQQYINFGVVPTKDWGLEVEAMTLSSVANRQVLCSNTDGGNNRWGFVEYPSAMWCPQWATWHSTDAALNANIWYNAKLNYDNDRKFIVDDVLYAIYPTNTTPTITIKTAQREIRYRKICFTIQGVLAYMCLSCYNKESGVIGLFDVINRTFYTNAGSGTFTKGQDGYPI